LIELTGMLWQGDSLALLDQRLLPHEEIWLNYDCANFVAEAIEQMVVRGAPAIGLAACFALVLEAQKIKQLDDLKACLEKAYDRLLATRPTAVNLQQNLNQMRSLWVSENTLSLEEIQANLLAKAQAIQQAEIDACDQMADLGVEHLKANFSQPIQVMTYCNTGSLATAGLGTALGVIKKAHALGLIEKVWVSETRPWLQGARLTAWELQRLSIPCTLHTDNAAGHILQNFPVSWVIVGADRIAKNGDVANKIGTFNLAVLAKTLGAKVMVVAPKTTVDSQLEAGQSIAIEQRSAEEVTGYKGIQWAPTGVDVYNPAFDVTPAKWIDAWVVPD
jgi:methylthioribose-1-phosphate isomerase